MTCDHLSYLLFGKFSFLNYIGRIAFPIFAFQITEGYLHTNNLKNYLLRLFVFAIISQLPFMLFYSMISGGIHLNIFFTLFLGLVTITIYDKLAKLPFTKPIFHRIYQLLGLLFAGFLAYLSSLCKCDYGYFGVLVIFSFYLFKEHKLLMNVSFILLVFFYQGKRLLLDSTYTYLNIVIFTLMALLPINLYNQQKGKATKYFLYLFYPIHLLLIYALHIISIL